MPFDQLHPMSIGPLARVVVAGDAFHIHTNPFQVTQVNDCR